MMSSCISHHLPSAGSLRPPRRLACTLFLHPHCVSNLLGFRLLLCSSSTRNQTLPKLDERKCSQPPPPRRSVDLPTTAAVGVSNTEIITQSHSPGPSPSHLLDSQKQHKAPVGLIVGVALAVIAALFGLFFVRYLFIRRKRRRETFAGAGGGRSEGRRGPRRARKAQGECQYRCRHWHAPRRKRANATRWSSVPTLPHLLLPPPSLPPTHTKSDSWSTTFTPSATAAEPGPESTPAARQAYLAAELRAAQSLLERAGRGGVGDKSIDVRATKARIRELEERQRSAWAMGLE
ncbi:hypothetical protein MSAN_01585000 [Mycena sanguinolenta]|uniref:Uncharacterized protein n=1 Tax=Mycena sanguinolenta TaxID=230812 RepID=A0A8H6Y3I9_9AGAR|nr:hypothetical protein MSAN_01585000 [Mycena sanguinolenta]